MNVKFIHSAFFVSSLVLPLMAQGDESPFEFIERAVEAEKVLVTGSSEAGVVEVKAAQCQDCSYEGFQPGDAIQFEHRETAISVDEAIQTWGDQPGVVIIDNRSGLVTRVVYY
ncbi:hypothetical protein [Marinobacter xestospongiae]|uniref:hypothetical protein n=1 Tax=Marinobacter xestospongiae TaxID=994319 RepID=UPI002006D243|nr:hypothetical protein [Marinobacter xestospongiae]MCK7568854.1 hypothetical protein [Marinobacter xestospongiae]